MSREIKFRAWDKKLKKMTDPFPIWNAALVVDGKHHVCFKEDMELMQFTGLKDKHGRDIYEGDIISMELLQCTSVGAVSYHEKRSIPVVQFPVFSDPWEPLHIYACDDPSDTCLEVIGNIHEHPGLLQEAS